MKQLLAFLIFVAASVSVLEAQPEIEVYLGDCDCPAVNTPPVCAEILPGLVVAVPSVCVAECLGWALIEGGDCSDVGVLNGGDWDDDDWDDDDDDYGDNGGDNDGDNDGDWDDDDNYGDNGDWNWSDSTWTGDWDDDYGDNGDWNWSDSTWTGDWDDDYGDNGDWDVSDSTWTGGWDDDFENAGLDSLLSDWLANGGQILVDSLFDQIENGGTIVFPPFFGDLNLDSLLATGDYSWLDSLLTGGGFFGDWDGLDVNLSGIWEDKGPEEEPENIGIGQPRTVELDLDWQCFPVPADDRLTVHVQGDAVAIECWTLGGQRVLAEAQPFTGTRVLETGAFAAGTYVVRVQDAGGQWTQQTVVIRH